MPWYVTTSKRHGKLRMSKRIRVQIWIYLTLSVHRTYTERRERHEDDRSSEKEQLMGGAYITIVTRLRFTARGGRRYAEDGVKVWWGLDCSPVNVTVRGSSMHQWSVITGYADLTPYCTADAVYLSARYTQFNF